MRREKAPAIGEAYVGPASLRLRQDIPMQSEVVATVKHGDRVEILQRRRRFLRVRTPSGAEGWTEENQLMNAAEMEDLKDLSRRAAKLPSQGQATTYAALNVHTQPAANAPSFLQIKEGEKFDVLADIVIPRQTVTRQPLITPAERKPPTPRKPARQGKLPPPPIPPPPGPPANWLDLSKTNLDEPPAPPEPAQPVPTEHWSLVRTAGGQAGWVLTRRASMAIPDEVAQYAEGHRIVSYFPLAYLQDGDAKKPVWLWTTSAGSHDGYDFDSFRVFIWSLKRHRYETAYIERNLTGYLPVLVHDIDYAGSGTLRLQAPAKYPGFSICTRKEDGTLHRREFALLGNVVRQTGESACQLPAPVWVAKAALAPKGISPVEPAAPPEQMESLLDRLKNRMKRMWRKNLAQPAVQPTGGG